MMKHSRMCRSVLVALALLAAAGCAADTSDQQANAAYDPGEGINRGIYGFNEAADHAVIGPVADAYAAALAPGFRDAIRNFLRNLATPVRVANQLLQGDVDGAGNEVGRFFINTATTLGLGDPASNEGYEHEEEDFGQTLAVWGVGEGPYIMLPLLGPSNLRDTVGLVVDTLADPLSYFTPTAVGISRGVGGGVDARARADTALEDLNTTSPDPYVTRRSIYEQSRESLIRDGERAPDDPFEDF